MGKKVSFTFDPTDLQLIAQLPKLNAYIEKKSIEALDMGAAAVLQRLRTNFRNETAPDGTKWIPSKAGEKRKAKGMGQTLFKTGNLFHSIQLSRPAENERVIGTDVEYAAKHQNGAPPRIIARPFIGLTEDDQALVVGIFHKRLKSLTLEDILK